MKKKLKPLNNVIQICPDCGKVDVYEGDGHDCDAYICSVINREMSED